GASFPGALATAATTSGRAILVSGLTVMVSMAGLLLTGIDLFTGIAVGTIMVVGVAVIGSLTFLPALLSLLGPWADRGRIPLLGRHRTPARPSRLPVVHTLDQIQRAFPGRPAPAQVVVTGGDVSSPAMRSEVAALQDSA